MPPGVDVVGHGRPDIFFFKKKKLQGGSMEGELPVNQEMSGCVGPDGRTKKKQNF